MPILQRWYNDKELYHYLGFLFFNFKAQTPFRDIYTQWKALNSRDKFLKDIQHTIATRMLDRYLEETEKAAPDYQKCLKTMTEAISDFRENWYNNDKELYQILILLDIFRILDSKSIKKLPTVTILRTWNPVSGKYPAGSGFGIIPCHCCTSSP